MSVPVLSRSLIACRTALASIAGPLHERFLSSPLEAPERATSSQEWLLTLRVPARQTRTLEPILFPKLRIYFADFPYLHCSIDQRLLTLETCCGYEYEQTRQSIFPPNFQGPSGTHRTRQEVSSFTSHRTISPGNQIPWCFSTRLLTRKENSSRGPCRRLRVHLRYRTSSENESPLEYPRSGSGILT